MAAATDSRGTDEGDRGERRRSQLGRAAVIALLAAFIALLAYGITTSSPDSSIDEDLAEGRRAPVPGFDLPVLQRGSPGRELRSVVERAAADGRLSLAELKGTPVVLNFWASWCTPCRDEAPELEQGWERGRAQGVLFVGLDMQDLTGDAREFMRDVGNTYLNARDKADDVARDWGVSGLPETFFIDRDGRAVGHVIGAISSTQLRAGAAAARSGRVLSRSEGGERRKVR